MLQQDKIQTTQDGPDKSINHAANTGPCLARGKITPLFHSNSSRRTCKSSL